MAEVGLGPLAAEERWHDGNISWTDTKKSSVLGCLSKVANAAAPIIETGGGDRGFVRGLGRELDDLEFEDDSRSGINFGIEEGLEDLGLEDDLGLGLEDDLELAVDLEDLRPDDDLELGLEDDLELVEDLGDLGLGDNSGIDVVRCGGSGSSCNSIVFP